MWKIARGVCAIDKKLKIKGFQMASRCYLCNKEEENFDYVLWYCSFSLNLWRWICDIFKFRNPISFHDVLGMANQKSSVIKELWIAVDFIILR